MARSAFRLTESHYEALARFEGDEDRGRFIMGLCAFAFDGIEPDFSDSPTLDVAFACMRDEVERQMDESRRNSANGARGGRRAVRQ